MRSLALFMMLVYVLYSQPRSGPPSFAPTDTEGLIMSPNPSIRHAWKRKVFWKASPGAPPGSDPRVPPPSPAERQQMSRLLDTLTALLKATPEGSQGEGFWVNESRTPWRIDVSEPPRRLVGGQFPLISEVGLFPHHHEDILDRAGWRLSVAGETESVYYEFNRLPGRLNQKVIASEDRGPDAPPLEFYLRPRETARWKGLPIYDGQILVVARAGRELWAPVTVGRVLKAALPLYRKDRDTAEARLADLRKKNEEIQAPAYEQKMRETFEKNNGSLRTTRPSNYQARLRSMEHELKYNRERASAEANPQRNAQGSWYWDPVDAYAEAAKRLETLAPAEAAKPACFAEAKGAQGRYSISGAILAAGSAPECLEIVQTNWEYFDLKLPRTAPQLLVIRDWGRCVNVDGDRLISRPVLRWDAPPQGCVRHAQMWRELDWTRFSALVQP